MSVTSTIFFLCIMLSILLVYRASNAEPLSGWVEPSAPKEFSFVVSIARKFDITTNNPYGHTCGGALIAHRYILTSASCFSPGKNASDYFVYAGSSDLAYCTKYEIKSWTTYDNWYRHKHRFHAGEASLFADNDVAVVKLFAKIRPPARITKVWNIQVANLVGRDVITAGWGLLFDDTTPQHMLKANLRVIDGNECKRKIQIQSNDASYNHGSNVFCTNAVTLFATLDDGDRGSPVFMRHEDGDYRIVGVNLKAVPSVEQVVEKPNQQNLHVGVHHYVDFIKPTARIMCF